MSLLKKTTLWYRYEKAIFFGDKTSTKPKILIKPIEIRSIACRLLDYQFNTFSTNIQTFVVKAKTINSCNWCLKCFSVRRSCDVYLKRFQSYKIN